jgi:cell division protein FtsW
VGVAAVLALAEPDFGTALLMATLCTGILLVCGTRLKYVLMAGAAVVPVLCLLVVHSPYRLRRITSFLDPWGDPLDSGYQLVQSLIAIGSGGLTGKGLGCGAMGFLPAARNDFIFSVIAEQLGLIGALAVIAVFAWIVWEGAKVAWRARDTFGFALALGLTGMIGLQAVVHIAVDAGAVPTKGLTLPFVSSGGSSLLFSMFAAGILINIALSTEEPDRWQLVAPDTDVPEYEHRLRSLAHNTACDVRNRLQRKERSVTWLPTPPAQDDSGE